MTLLGLAQSEVYNQTFWTCSNGDKTFTFKEKIDNPDHLPTVTSGTWILTDSPIDADASDYKVYSVTFGELGDFENQFQICDEDSCANPARWLVGQKSTEHRLLPMHHLLLGLVLGGNLDENFDDRMCP